MGLEIFERGALPHWVPIRQQLDATDVSDVAAVVATEFARPEIAATIRSGQTVALTAGSRGIDKIDRVIAAAVNEVRRLGGEPFVVPAMGSHGGATAEGQLEMLSHFGVTEGAMGCPIRSSMETVHLGEVEDGVPVWFDKNAHGADVVIPIGRVKPHTDFHGPVESGLMKMIAIGLGKQKGADFFHSQGMNEFHHLIPAVAGFTLTRINIPFGLALIENGYGHLSQVEAVPAARIWTHEQELLQIARDRLGRLPGEAIDVLLIDQIGKDISGDGADPNVINRDVVGLIATSELSLRPTIQRVIMRGLTPDTEGNATGLGMADLVLQRVVDEMDPIATYMNVITAKAPQGARIPLTVATDRQALSVALACCVKTSPETAKIARIRDTKHVETLLVSEPLLPEMLASGRVEVLGDPRPIAFGEDGMLLEAIPTANP